MFKLAQLTLDLALAWKLTCPCYLLLFNFLCSLQSSTAITLRVLLVHWCFFFPWYHLKGLYQFSISVIFKFYMFIALLIIMKRWGDERKERKNRIHTHLLWIYNGYSHVVTIVHHRMLSIHNSDLQGNVLLKCGEWKIESTDLLSVFFDFTWLFAGR